MYGIKVQLFISSSHYSGLEHFYISNLVNELHLYVSYAYEKVDKDEESGMQRIENKTKYAYKMR